jgi:hypothetical protein
VSASKDLDGLGLDLLPDQRMQAVPRGQVDVYAQAFLKQPFCGHQIKGIELATGVVIEKEIEITLATGLVAGRRTKQIKRHRPALFQSACKSTKSFQGLCPVHGSILP